MRINRLRPHNIFQDAQSGKGGVKKDLQKIRVLILTSVIMSAIFFCMSWFAASGRLNWNLKILFKWKRWLKHWESCSLHICDIRTGDDFNESEFLPHLRGYFSIGFSKCSLCEAKMIHRGNSFIMFVVRQRTLISRFFCFYLWWIPDIMKRYIKLAWKHFDLKFILTCNRFNLTSTQYVTLSTNLSRVYCLAAARQNSAAPRAPHAMP